MTDSLLDVKETAKKLRISCSFLYQIVEQKRISCYQIGRRRLFSEQQIQDFLRQQLIEAQIKR